MTHDNDTEYSWLVLCGKPRTTPTDLNDDGNTLSPIGQRYIAAILADDPADIQRILNESMFRP